MTAHMHRIRAFATFSTALTLAFASVLATPTPAPGAVMASVLSADGEEPPPDRDGDGLADDVDQCPDTPGSATYNGCPVPDSDGDGVYDDTDQCPSDPGSATYNGCPVPDSDGDGLADDVDACPNLPGPYDGCPLVDFDGDGVTDDIDQCPNVAGSISNFGCPDDGDGDGVPDGSDSCPDTAVGEGVDSAGCSMSQLDTDGDGVNDAQDQCPATPTGTAVDATGCALPVAVRPTAVRFYDRCGRGKDTFVIPVKQGIVYKRGSAVIAGGTYPGRRDVRITAAAAPNFTLLGTRSWARTFTDERCRPGRVFIASPHRRLIRIGNKENQPATVELRGHRWRVGAGATRYFATASGSTRWSVRWDDFYGKQSGTVEVR